MEDSFFIKYILPGIHLLLVPIITVITTYFFNLKMKNQNFKDDYYKLILNKRIEALEKVHEMVNILYQYDIDENDNKKFRVYIGNLDNLLKYVNIKTNIFNYKIYLSNEINIKINEFESFISDYSKFNFEENLNKSKINFEMEEEKIIDFLVLIHESYLKLGDIETFLKEKNQMLEKK